jgi:Subtilase family
MTVPDFADYDPAIVKAAEIASERRIDALFASSDSELMLCIGTKDGMLTEIKPPFHDSLIGEVVVMHRYRVWIPNYALATVGDLIEEKGGVAVHGSSRPTRHGLQSFTEDHCKTPTWSRSDTPAGKRYVRRIDEHGSTADLLAKLGVTLVDFSARKGEFDSIGFVNELRKLRMMADDGLLATPETLMFTTGWDLGPFGPPTPTNATVSKGSVGAGDSVTVLVMDSGRVGPQDFIHPAWAATKQLSDVANSPIDQFDDRDDPYDSRGATPVDHVIGEGAVHGSFIAGVIEAHVPGAEILVSRVCEASRHYCSEWEAITDLWAALAALNNPEHRRKGVVVNMSFGSALNDTMAWVFSQAVANILDWFPSTIIVASAGNHAESRKYYPAAIVHDRVLSVGSLRARSDRCSDFSNYGNWVKAWVAGEDVVGPFVPGHLSAFPTSKWLGSSPMATWSGTSFAAPQLAATVALQLSTGTPPAQVMSKLSVGANHPKRKSGNALVTEQGVIVN